MKILLNNRKEVFDREEMTVSDLLKEKKMTFRMRIVKINGNLVEKDKYDTTQVSDGDNVQVIYLMSGG
ncbi:MAG: sulfur carrier protein ThiS [Bacteroidales bacterium]